MGLFDNPTVLGRSLRTSLERWESTDAESVLAAVLDEPLCVSCIVERSGVARTRVESILRALGTTLGIGWMRWLCASCQEPGDIYRLA